MGPRSLKTILAVLIGGWILALLILAAVPPVSRDALTHHLAVPKRYLQAGQIHEIADIVFSYYPMNLDLLYLIPLAFGNDILPKYIHFAFALLSAWLIFNYLKRHLGSLYGLCGVLLFITLPVIVKLSITAYVDLGLIFFSSAALLLLFEWLEKGFRPRHLILAAVSCGLALGTKYNGLPVFLILSLAVPVIYVRYAPSAPGRQLKGFLWGVAFAGIALLVFSPWMLRNYLWTENPLYPLFENWFHPGVKAPLEGMGHFTLRRVVHGEPLWQTLTIPVRIFFQGQDGNPRLFDGRLNPYLFFLPLMGLFIRSKKDSPKFRTETGILFFFSILYLLVVFFTNEMRVRYLGPMIPPLVILSIVSLQRISARLKGRRGATVFVYGILLGLVSLNGLYLGDQFREVRPFAYLRGRVGRDAYIERFRPEYAALQYANKNLFGRVKILGLFMGERGYYSDHEIIFGKERFKRIVKGAGTSGEILSELRRQGVTHILVGLRLYNQWSGFSFTKDEKERLDRFYHERLQPLFAKGGYRLFALKRPKGGGGDVDPWRDALDLIGLSTVNLKRPLAYEEGYLLLAHNRLIDRVAASPFALHDWAQETSRQYQANVQKGIYETLAVSIKTLSGTVSHEAASLPGPTTVPDLEAGYRHLSKSFGESPSRAALDAVTRAGFSKLFSRRLGGFLLSLADAALLIQKGLSGLTEAEYRYLVSRPERFFYPHQNRFAFLTAPTHVQARIYRLSQKVDFVSLHKAALILARACDSFAADISRLKSETDPAPYFQDGKRREGLVLDIPSPLGELVILGQGDDIWSGGGALLIDLGGDDRYLGPIGVAHLQKGHLSLAIDIAGNDTYERPRKSFGQGFGCLGVGIISDLEGDDTYLAGDMSQGAGIYGIGILADLAGNDRYQMGLLGQGFGLFGIGLLIDAAGDDIFLNRGLGQGTGSTLGLGTLCDRKGNDAYISDRNQILGELTPDTWSHSQGVGLSVRAPDWTRSYSFYGGIGLLSEGAGDDTYLASDGNCMGAGYFMSIGALVDHAGNDIYTPKNGTGLGWGVHLANGILIDEAGDDHYAGTFQCGGVGSDRSIGFLADHAGNDTYGDEKKGIFSSRAFGASLKPKGLGILIDNAGNDRYLARNPKEETVCGGVVPPESADKWSHALLLDLGGEDFYAQKGRRENSYHIAHGHGVSYDVAYPGQHILRADALPPKRPEAEERLEQIDPVLRPDVADFFSLDLFVRHAAVGRLVEAGPKVLNPLLVFLAQNRSQDVNREALQIMDSFMLRGQMPERQKFEALLYGADPFVRRYAVRTFGWRKTAKALPALTAALQNEESALRADLFWAIGRIGTREAIDVLINAFEKEKMLSARRNIMMGLAQAELTPDKIPPRLKSIFTAGLNDPDEIIRSYAAFGMGQLPKEPEIVRVLSGRILQADESVYVKRGAARALIRLHEKKGIAALIETLRFPSIDTLEFYDHDLAKELAFYCGTDFGDDKRYRYETWKAWWTKNGKHVDLALNLKIMGEIEAAFAAPDEKKGLRIFRELRRRHPQNVVIQKRYRRFCHDWIHYRLLGLPEMTPTILKRCIRLQEIVITLEPHDASARKLLAYFKKELMVLQGDG